VIYFVVFVADLLRSESLCYGFSLSGCAIFIGAGDVKRLIAFCSTVSSKHVSRENTSNDVTQMRHVVHVRKSRCDQHISLAFYRKTEKLIVFKCLKFTSF
jgi:hypothetical protein